MACQIVQEGKVAFESRRTDKIASANPEMFLHAEGAQQQKKPMKTTCEPKSDELFIDEFVHQVPPADGMSSSQSIKPNSCTSLVAPHAVQARRDAIPNCASWTAKQRDMNRVEMIEGATGGKPYT
jgi:hypothetical protein